MSGKKSGIWMTIYADMITTLMFFFLAAWILSRMDATTRVKVSESFQKRAESHKYKDEKKDIVKEVSKELSSLKSATGGPDQGPGYSQIEINEKKIKITLPGDVSFASGSSTLSEETKKTLKDIASILKRTNNPIIVEGFTDNVPMTRGNNWELSLSRAISVVDYLVSSENVPRRRIMAAGYGEYKPLVPNDTPENKRRNRRIEITVLRYE